MSISSRTVTSTEADKTKEEIADCRKELHAMVKRLSTMKRQLIAQKEYIEVAVKDAVSELDSKSSLSGSPYNGKSISDNIVDYRVKLYKHRAFIGRIVNAIKAIKAISSGSGHSLILDKYGRVYSFGSNGYGQLGDGNGGSGISVTIPTQIAYLNNIIAISSGMFHSLILDKNGRVYGFGSNEYGQLGDGNGGYGISAPIPTKIADLNNIIAISAGGNHSLALDKYGLVYSFGRNHKGQLGNGTGGSGISVTIPTQIADLNNIIAISSGRYHSLALDTAGQVYSFGYNEYGQLGDGTSGSDRWTTIPTKIADLNSIIAISAGWGHSLALNTAGQVYSFGYNEYGQLGLGHYINQLLPTKIDDLNNIIEISAGTIHSLALNTAGQVYSFGWNRFGRLGISYTTTDKVNTPTKIDASNIISNNIIAISAGYDYSLILDKNEEVYGFGHNELGQLGVGNSGYGNFIDIPNKLSIDLVSYIDDMHNSTSNAEITAGYARAIKSGGGHQSPIFSSNQVLSGSSSSSDDPEKTAQLSGVFNGVDIIGTKQFLIGVNAILTHPNNISETLSFINYDDISVINSQYTIISPRVDNSDYDQNTKSLSLLKASRLGWSWSSVFDQKHHMWPSIDSFDSWNPDTPDLNQWLKLDLEKIYNVTGVVLQARGPGKNNGNHIRYVKTFTVRGGKDRTIAVDDEHTFDAVAAGIGITSSSRDSKAYILFKNPVVTRYISIFPKTWHDNGSDSDDPNNGDSVHIGIRLGVIVDRTVLSSQNYIISPRVDNSDYDQNNKTHSESEAARLGWSWSSVFDQKHHMWPSIDSFDSWNPDTPDLNQWLQLDLKRYYNVTGVVLQARGPGKNNGNHIRYVKTFTVRGGKNRDIKVDDEHTFDAVAAGIGITSSTRDRKAYILFKNPVATKYISIFPKTWHDNGSDSDSTASDDSYHIGIRLGVIVGESNVSIPYNIISNGDETRQFNTHTYNPGTKYALSTGVLKGLLMQGNENLTAISSSNAIQAAIPLDTKDYTTPTNYLKKIRGFGLE